MNSVTKNKSFTLWPYAVVICMVLFMAYIASFVYKAMNRDVNLVSQNYYEQEINYQDPIEKVRRTQALGDVMLKYNSEEKTILLQMPATYKELLLTGTITLFRPSNDKLDMQIPLQLGRDQSQLVDVSDLENGLWKVRVYFSAADETYFSEKTIQLK